VSLQLVMLNGTSPDADAEELNRCSRTLEATLRSQIKKNAQIRNGVQQQAEVQQEPTSRFRI
jgi:hypothetical protein